MAGTSLSPAESVPLIVAGGSSARESCLANRSRSSVDG
jgi:hypothetical protein